LSEWKPDPEFWKKVAYHNLWKRHMEKVEALEKKLKKSFPKERSPDLGVRFGLGANTDKWLKIPPDEKGEPDFTLFYQYKKICYIEVSGSDKITMGPSKDIWIRPDKYEHAESRKEETWFYMVYPNQVLVLNKKAIEPHKDERTVAYIKKNKLGRKIPERYIPISYEEAFAEETMFEWIKKEITRQS